LRLAGVLLAGTLLLSGCADDDAAPAAAEDARRIATQPPDTLGLPDDIYIADEDAVDTAPPPVIYYDLTRYDWYARGEPLVHEGWNYAPGGLVAASGGEMEALGEYGGVTYYRRRDGGVDSLFVPVFERYWLTFNPGAAADTVAVPPEGGP
jgi:hypothetical protein